MTSPSKVLNLPLLRLVPESIKRPQGSRKHHPQPDPAASLKLASTLHFKKPGQGGVHCSAIGFAVG
ncbi:hypothetical protein A2U01_0090341, partial [Trifolium medium]|nr:hypothetical protein [Trifolium medium]